MTEEIDNATGGQKRAGHRRIDLTPAEQVALAGALRRDLDLPDTDHETLRAVLARLLS